MELYHIHKNNEYDELFKVGNVISFDKKPNKMREDSLNGSSTIPFNMIDSNGNEYILRKNIMDFLDFDAIKDMSIRDQIKLLENVRACLYNGQMDMREYILEDIRLRYYNERPSRYSCVWLSDERSLETWKKVMNKANKDYSVFRVEAEGNLFISTNGLLPHAYISKKLIENQAHNYWNPAPMSLKTNDREILLEGDMKILEEVERVQNRVK